MFACNIFLKQFVHQQNGITKQRIFLGLSECDNCEESWLKDALWRNSEQKLLKRLGLHFSMGFLVSKDIIKSKGLYYTVQTIFLKLQLPWLSLVGNN